MDLPKFKTRELQSYPLEAVTTLYKDALYFAEKPEVIVNETTERMVWSIRQRVWGERVGTYTVKYPDGWFQFFKQSYFPQWALKRWPVKFHRDTLTFHALFPDYVAPKSLGRVQFAIMDRPMFRDLWGTEE